MYVKDSWFSSSPQHAWAVSNWGSNNSSLSSLMNLQTNASENIKEPKVLHYRVY